jgi:hypothetical protein
VRFLIEEVGVPVNSGGQWTSMNRMTVPTALHLACRGGHDAVVAVLLEFGVNVTIWCRRSLAGVDSWLTPLGEAAYSGAMQSVRTIVEVAGGDCDQGAIVLATEAGHADIVRYLLGKWPSADKDEAFGVAVVRNDGRISKMLSRRSKFVWGASELVPPMGAAR